MIRLATLVVALVLASPLATQAAETLADGPALSAPGAYPVGVRTVTLSNPDQPDLLASDLATGKIVRHDRVLPVTIWYPTTKPKAGAATVRYTQPGATPVAPPVFYQTGAAYPDATPT